MHVLYETARPLFGVRLFLGIGGPEMLRKMEKPMAERHEHRHD